ncbi:MAG: hypothetical protein ABGY41_08165, partial [Candidatus Poribacteria bacterium]
GERPVTSDARRFGSSRLIPDLISLILTMPDGSVRTYRTNVIVSGMYMPENYPTLQPGDTAITHINIQEQCRPSQPGTYTAFVTYGGAHVVSATSGKLAFRLEPPSQVYVDDLLAELDVSELDDESYRPMAPPGGSRPGAARMRARNRRSGLTAALYELGQLREPRALEPIHALAALPRHLPGVRDSGPIALAARDALAQYDAPELIPFWIDLLHKGDEAAQRHLVRIRDTRVFAPLRELAFGSGDRDAATHLRKMADDSAIRFIHWSALAFLERDDESTWNRGQRDFALMLSGEDLADQLGHR